MHGPSRLPRTRRALGAVLLLCGAPTARAAIYTVNTAIDPPSESSSRCSPGNANTCSLRDAVAATAFSFTPGDRIVFDPAVTRIDLARPITLNTRAGISTQHVIDGGGRVVLDGGGGTRLFTTEMPSGGTSGGGAYRLVGLTLRNGRADRGAALYRPLTGGGVLSGGNRITFERCRLENHQASDDGGAIFAGGMGVSLIATTFSGNSAANDGGAIWAASPIYIDWSTFVGNSAGSGGAIHGAGGPMQITNSTLTGNLATQTNSGGGIFSQESTLDLLNVTLSANTGLSLVQVGSLDISSPPPPSIVRNTYVQDCALLFTTNVSGSHNLTLDPLCQAHGAAWLALGNPLLAPLADNGGPTPTLLPSPGSPAIDAGDDAACADPTRVAGLDQRGARRPAGAHCDIGAVEAGAEFSLEVSVVGNGSVSSSDGRIGACSATGGTCSATYSATPGSVDLAATAAPGSLFLGWSGDCSGTAPSLALATDFSHACTATFDALVLVVDVANSPAVGDPLRCTASNPGGCGLSDAVAAARGGDTITFAPGLATVVTGAEIVFADTSGSAVTVDGNGAVNLVGGANRILHAGPGTKTVLKGLRANFNGVFAGDGAALYNEGDTLLEACSLGIARNLPDGADAKGGAIFNAASGDLRLTECTVSGNSAGESGGGIYNQGRLTVVASTLADNRTRGSSGGGGHLYNAGVATLINSTLTRGSSAASGGALHNSGAASLTNVTVADNAATVSAAGIYNAGDLTLGNSLVHGCALAAGTLTDRGGNLDGGASCGLTAATSRSNAYLALAALADHGGTTRTMLPGAGSAAFDAGIDSLCLDPAGVAGIDQRGAPRPLGAHCDAGAIETPQPPPLRLGGMASGHADAVTLQLTTTNPPGSQQTVVAVGDAAFGFDVVPGSDWIIHIAAAPAGQTCTLAPDSGLAIAADIDDLALNCTTNPPLQISTTHGDLSCHGGSNGVASATATGGTPPYSYRWSPSGGVSSSANGLAAGDYTVTVTDALGASASAQVTIASPAPIAFASTTLVPGRYGSPYATVVAASGGTGTLSYGLASGALPPGMNLSADGALSGPSAPASTYDFRVVARDANACEASQPFTLVIAPAALTVTANDATRAYGAADPVFSARFSGFVDGDTEADLTPALTFTTDARTNSPAGRYAIIAAGTVGANYAPTFVDGTLTITGAAQATSMTLIATPDSAVAGQALRLTATVTATDPSASAAALAAATTAGIAGAAPSGTVTFHDGPVALGSGTLDANGIANLTTTSLAPGQHTLSATYAGDAVFAQSSATASVTILGGNVPIVVPVLSQGVLAWLGALLAAFAMWRAYPRKN